MNNREHGEPRIDQEIIKEAWQKYGDLQALAQSPLASAELPHTLLWQDDTPSQALGFAVQALLRWSLQQLAASASEQVRDYADILQMRYVERLTVEIVARKLNTSPKNLKRRQRTAWGKSAEIIQTELQQQHGSLEQVQLMCRVRYEALSAEQQLTVHYLALFEQPERLTFLNLSAEHKVEKHFQTLLNRNLVTSVSNKQYQLHPQFAPFVRKQIGMNDSHNWHAFLGELYQSDGRFLQAARHLQLAERWDTAAQLLIAQKSTLGEYEYGRRDSLGRWQALLQQFERRMVAAGPLSAEQWAHINILLGNIHKLTEDPLETALAAYQRAMRSAETTATQAEIHFERGHAYQAGNVTEAIFHLDQCCQLAAESDDALTQYWHCKARLTLAWLYITQQVDIEKSARLLNTAERQLENNSGADWLGLSADYHNTWSEYYKYQQDRDKQVSHGREAVLMADRANDPLRIVKLTYQLGVAYYLKGTGFYASARDMLEKSYQWAEQIGYDVMCGEVQNALGALVFDQSADYTAAIEHYTLARAAFKRAGVQRSLAATCYNLAEAFTELGQIETGLTYLTEGSQVAQESNNSAMRDRFEAYLRKQYPELNANINAHQRQAIQHARLNGGVTNKAYQALTGRSQKQTVRDLNDLVEQGILERIGRGRGTKYILTNPPTHK